MLLNRIDLRDSNLTPRELAAALPRADQDVAAALEAVSGTIADVRERGAAALRDAAERFDHVRPTHLRVPAAALQEALEGLDPAVREALELSIAHNRAGHAAQLPTERDTEIIPGGHVLQRWIPVRRVGLYAPGGLAVYPSSVVMNAVAAQVAGVEQIALASPPQPDFDGLPHPTVLAACALLGITEVYAAGGAQAIALFAYGADAADDVDRADSLAAGGDGRTLCEPVDVVAGPGNVYVAAAKRAVRGTVGIDAEAGPTEIAVVADSGADPEYVAADLLSQAEHDPNAGSVLITDSPRLADAVDAALARRLDATRHRDRARTALTGAQSAIVLVRDLDQAVEVADAYAAEHLEIQTSDAAAVARRIHNAGAIFVGPYSPVPLGDYLAGSNHVLPTGGTARFAAGLNVMAYLKPVQVIDYDADALGAMTAPLTALAESENLPAHGEAVGARRQR
ncbi:MAG: histidinol dehydrogenase [Actinomyces ruminicola]|uniref:Histidinol dehydrogenase n=1 Tax=Actinomyces ruminicola TaxID=332524 RepID=A0A1G9TLR5_9ACTO|nr:histidinol dehydrogenase [Actinomyces ruminicola]MBE6481016.1 histidinol dehydrogenase [Actinomyces ruminicola]SDM48716.1 histidinol dehydrogenase [Actinomyces ruminicola]